MQRHEITAIVCETLTALGFDIKDPQAAQADLIYLRKMRVGSDMMSSRMKFAIASTLLSSGFYLIWMGIKAAVKLGG